MTKWIKYLKLVKNKITSARAAEILAEERIEQLKNVRSNFLKTEKSIISRGKK